MLFFISSQTLVSRRLCSAGLIVKTLNLKVLVTNKQKTFALSLSPSHPPLLPLSLFLSLHLILALSVDLFLSVSLLNFLSFLILIYLSTLFLHTFLSNLLLPLSSSLWLEQWRHHYLVVTSSPWDALFLFLSLRLSHHRRSREASKAKKVSFVAAAVVVVVAVFVVAVVVEVVFVAAAQQDLPEKRSTRKEHWGPILTMLEHGLQPRTKPRGLTNSVLGFWHSRSIHIKKWSDHFTVKAQRGQLTLKY